VHSAPLVLHVTTVPMSLTFLRGQVGFMKRRGLRIRATSSPGAELWAFGCDEDVPVDSVEMPRSITPMRDLSALARLFGILRKTRPAIVHAHTPKAGLLGMIAATLAGVPVRIYHMRGLPLMSATGWKRRLLWSTEWLTCRLAHEVLCVSHSLRREALREKLTAPSKITVLAGGSGNGVDAADRFHPERVGSNARGATREELGIPSTATVIGFVGRIVRDKGVIELTRAWESIREDFPEAHLLLVGPFESQDPVPVEIETVLRGDTRVHLRGMDWNTPPLYAAMDVVVLPTYREGFPNVPLEAAAMELPVVATEVPGCTDAVQRDVTGTLVPARDADALARAIVRYLEDPELRQTHGNRGRSRVLQEFSQPVIWEALYRKYVTLMRSRGLKGPDPVSGSTGAAEHDQRSCFPQT
jgi:glycosyltransferase involved in cell wall biosynthesis